MRRFADALALNWLIGGTDAHAKNYSFLYPRSIARLAPLHDVAGIGDLAERLPAAFGEVCSEIRSPVASLAGPIRHATLRSLPQAKSALARGPQVAATRP